MDPTRAHEQSPEQKVISKWQQALDTEIERISGIIQTHLSVRSVSIPSSSIERVTAEGLYPGLFDTSRGQVVPIDEGTLKRIIPGFNDINRDRLATLTQYAEENYGSIPGPAAALVENITEAIQPGTVFVFGTGKGRIEALIAANCPDAEIVSIDLPTELFCIDSTKPDKNNGRYRTKLGIERDADIGTICTSDPQLPRRFHQLLGNSFTFGPGRLSGTMDMVVIDANHQLPFVLMDIANALTLIKPEGGYIIIDDVRKESDLNCSVEAACVIASQYSHLPLLRPTPKPKEEGFRADAGIFVIPSDFDPKLKLSTVAALRNLALSMRD